MLKKLNIPEIYKDILEDFSDHNLEPHVFKHTEIANGEVGGLDILFPTDNKYKAAIRLAKKKGYIIYFSEKNEPYKTMLVLYTSEAMKVIHLHRRIGWLGLPYLDHKKVCSRSRNLGKGINIPSDEDSLMIHAAHILFENYKVRRFEKTIFETLLRKDLDWEYIETQLRKYSWSRAFHAFIEKIKDNRSPGTWLYIWAFILRLFNRDFLRSLYFLAKQSLQSIGKKLSLKRKGLFVACCGVNGTGKSTLTNSLSAAAENAVDKLKLPVDTYYYGWVPFFPWSKWISRKRKQQKKKFYRQSAEESVPRFSLKLELFFAYIFIEYYARYIFHIYPILRNRGLIISDRYFYHIYGQYPYAEKSPGMKLWLKLFPKPDYTFVLDLPESMIAERRKDVIIEHIKGQQHRYETLPVKKEIINPMVLDPETIFQKVYRRWFRKMRY